MIQNLWLSYKLVLQLTCHQTQLSRPAWENSVSSQEPQLIISLMSRSQLWTEENILIRNNILCKSDTETCQRVLIFLGLGITCFIIGWFNFLIIVNKSKVFLMFFGRVTFISIIRSTFSPATTRQLFG